MCLGDVYGSTFELLGENLPQFGIDTMFLTAREVDQIPGVLTDRTRIISSRPRRTPLLIFDIAAIFQQAHAAAHRVYVGEHQRRQQHGPTALRSDATSVVQKRALRRLLPPTQIHTQSLNRWPTCAVSF